MATTVRNDDDPRRIATVVAVRFSALGDVAMTIPVVYALCRTYPRLRVVMVTKKATAGLFVNRPDNLVVEGIDLHTDYSGPTAMLRLWRDLRRRYGFLFLADLHDVLRTKLLRAIARFSPVRVAVIDKGRAAKAALIGSSISHPRPLQSSFGRYADVFARLGFPVADEGGEKFTTITDPAAPTADISAVAPAKLPGERWIAIAPFAAHTSKIYPAELMTRVIELLGATPGVRLFFFGAGEAEQSRIEEWIAGNPRAISLAGRRLGFATELELLSRMDAALTMDSANMHLALLAGVRTVSLWGATHPCFGFGGWKADAALQLGVELDCRPCSVFGNATCRRGDMACFRLIDPRSVVDRLLGQ